VLVVPGVGIEPTQIHAGKGTRRHGEQNSPLRLTRLPCDIDFALVTAVVAARLALATEGGLAAGQKPVRETEFHIIDGGALTTVSQLGHPRGS
jgi:hypothetical protein